MSKADIYWIISAIYLARFTSERFSVCLGIGAGIISILFALKVL